MSHLSITLPVLVYCVVPNSRILALLIDFSFQHTKFFCTATILKLSPSQRWWFFSCKTCHKSAVPYGATYRCSDTGCATVEASPRYRLCYIAGDGQDEIEFVFFDRVGKQILGKPLISILRAGHSSSTSLEDIVNSTKGDTSIPRELAAIVSTKYRFVVQVTSKSFESESTRPSYQVQRIDANFGKQPHSSALRHRSALGAASSSQSPADQSHLMIGSPSAARSPSSAVSALEDSYGTNSGYILSPEKGPPSISKLPSLRKKDASPISAARKVLFVQDGGESQTEQNQIVIAASPRSSLLTPPLPWLRVEGSPAAILLQRASNPSSMCYGRR